MQNYILKTNEKYDINIKPGSKIAITAIFVNEDLGKNILISLLENNINIQRPDELYWNLISNPQWITSSEVFFIIVNSVYDFYFNLSVSEKNVSPLNLEINFNDDIYLTINKDFCNNISEEDCPDDFLQCYNHQREIHKNFCSKYQETNIKEPTEIEQIFREKIEQRLRKYNNYNETEKSTKIKYLENKLIQEKKNLEILNNNFIEKINNEKKISDNLKKQLSLNENTIKNLSEQLSLNNIENIKKENYINKESYNIETKKFLFFICLVLLLIFKI